MKNKHLLSISSMTSDEILDIIKLAGVLKKKPHSKPNVLKGKTLALLFQKPSNRTRVSFEVAMTHLGGYTLYLSPQEINMGERESVKDVGAVISRYVDAIVARVFHHRDIETLAKFSTVPVINGLSDLAHPAQALSDIFTIKEKFGSFKGVKLAYVGDGNNVLNSLLFASCKAGLDINVATPRNYGIRNDILDRAIKLAKVNKVNVNISNNPFEAVKGADIVYTDVWVSMGQEDEKEKRLKDFEGFQINEKLLKATGKKTLIMHCLPAHRGEEITDVIDGKTSIVYDQAENRMHVEKAMLVKILG